MKKVKVLLAAMIVLFQAGCAGTSEDLLLPLKGLEWFSGYDDVRNEFSGYTLIEEREKGEGAELQRMQDYADVMLFEKECDLTLCFTDIGLVGFNYHDIDSHMNYKEWFSTLESSYGYPTEEGRGMASWYDDPLGNNTAVYLFNLEEGVQISFYASANTPDKNYKGQKQSFIPSPEINTPIIPVSDGLEETIEMNETVSDNTTVKGTAEVNGGNYSYQNVQGNYNETEIWEQSESASVNETGTASPFESVSSTRTEIRTSSVVTTVKADEFRQNGLEFYGSPDNERSKMSAYTLTYEYRTEERGQPWEIIMEYGGLKYMDKKCDTVLCFTSLGLVGINYFDSNKNDYSYWKRQLTKLYGKPEEVQDDYCAWNDNPIGNGTMIYVYGLEDGVQISFFADDTGSELS